MLQPFRAMNRVQVENRAGVWLFGPSQETLIIAFNQPHCSINQLDVVLAKIVSNLREEVFELCTRNVDFGNDFGSSTRSMQAFIDLLVIVVRINTELMRV